MTIIEELDADGNVVPDKADNQDEGHREQRDKLAGMETEERKRVARQFALGEEYKGEGNKLFAEGDVAGAVKRYERALHELTMVGNEADARERAEKDNMALNLNLALAKLKLEDYEEVKHHCASALLADPTNAKALYRRGLAQAALARSAMLFQEAEAKAAIADFEAALETDPGSAECRRELLKLRVELRAHERDLARKQKETWTQVFGGRTVIEGEEDPPPDEPLPAVRPCVNTDKHLIVSLEGASVANEGTGVLGPIDLELREGWCVGISGGPRAARTALANLFAGQASATSGHRALHPKPRKPGRRAEDTEPIDRSVLIGGAVLLIAMLAAMEYAEVSSLQLWMMRVMVPCLLGLIRVMWSFGVQEPLKLHVELATSALAALAALKATSTVEELLGTQLAKQLPKDERRDKVVALLCAAGFQGSGEAGGSPQKFLEAGLRFGDLPVEQQRIVHILRCIAARPEVLICDDALEGLPVGTQARFLRMLKRMKQECKTSVLCMSDDLDQVSYMADSLGFLSQEGSLCEKGPAQEVLETPRHEESQGRISAYLQQTGQKTPLGGPVHERCKELLTDSALNGQWLPPKYT